ncbi:hypothetical protein HYH03_016828 [Edaphochlamys debaryana]|uniref:Uncharacterized protein n=1 Tax=Edaphochlamys debaryana TaxID=47281 RepID=A0A835XQS3_9CHLO|nr:hypothetical protein HYH03_016828 [Edaphochlamys debaryana]|eukprot:KAG2484414.1 hypothetical protein HYH03_016828 [Edaphochlamys debaryana]
MASSDIVRSVRATFPPLTTYDARTRSYRLLLPLAKDAESGGARQVGPPAEWQQPLEAGAAPAQAAGAAAAWPAWALQGLIVASEYCAALTEYVVWCFGAPTPATQPFFDAIATAAQGFVTLGTAPAPGPAADELSRTGHTVWAAFTHCYWLGVPGGRAADATPDSANPQALSRRDAARAWLRRLVGPVCELARGLQAASIGGWREGGPALRAARDWAAATRERLQLPAGLTAAAHWAAQAQALQPAVQPRERETNPQNIGVFVPVYPRSLTNGYSRNRFKMDGKTNIDVKGKCGVPDTFSSTHNCAIALLVLSDLLRAAKQAVESLKVPEDKAAAKLRLESAITSPPPPPQGQPHPPLDPNLDFLRPHLTACVLGWEVALGFASARVAAARACAASAGLQAADLDEPLPPAVAVLPLLPLQPAAQASPVKPAKAAQGQAAGARAAAGAGVSQAGKAGGGGRSRKGGAAARQGALPEAHRPAEGPGFQQHPVQRAAGGPGAVPPGWPLQAAGGGFTGMLLDTDAGAGPGPDAGAGGATGRPQAPGPAAALSGQLHDLSLQGGGGSPAGGQQVQGQDREVLMALRALLHQAAGMADRLTSAGPGDAGCWVNTMKAHIAVAAVSADMALGAGAGMPLSLQQPGAGGDLPAEVVAAAAPGATGPEAGGAGSSRGGGAEAMDAEAEGATPAELPPCSGPPSGAYPGASAPLPPLTASLAFYMHQGGAEAQGSGALGAGGSAAAGQTAAAASGSGGGSGSLSGSAYERQLAATQLAIQACITVELGADTSAKREALVRDCLAAAWLGGAPGASQALPVGANGALRDAAGVGALRATPDGLEAGGSGGGDGGMEAMETSGGGLGTAALPAGSLNSLPGGSPGLPLLLPAPPPIPPPPVPLPPRPNPFADPSGRPDGSPPPSPRPRGPGDSAAHLGGRSRERERSGRQDGGDGEERGFWSRDHDAHPPAANTQAPTGFAPGGPGSDMFTSLEALVDLERYGGIAEGGGALAGGRI